MASRDASSGRCSLVVDRSASADLRRSARSRRRLRMAAAAAPVPRLALVGSLSLDDLNACAGRITAWHRARHRDAAPADARRVRALARRVPDRVRRDHRALTRSWSATTRSTGCRSTATISAAPARCRSRAICCTCGRTTSKAAARPADVDALVRESAPGFAAAAAPPGASGRRRADSDRATSSTTPRSRIRLDAAVVGDLLALADAEGLPPIDAVRLFPAYLAAMERARGIRRSMARAMSAASRSPRRPVRLRSSPPCSGSASRPPHRLRRRNRHRELDGAGQRFRRRHRTHDEAQLDDAHPPAARRQRRRHRRRDGQDVPALRRTSARTRTRCSRTTARGSARRARTTACWCCSRSTIARSGLRSATTSRASSPTALPDEISRQTMVPFFRQGDYGGGLLAGVDHVRPAHRPGAQRHARRCARSATPSPTTRDDANPSRAVHLSAFIVIINIARGESSGRRARATPAEPLGQHASVRSAPGTAAGIAAAAAGGAAAAGSAAALAGSAAAAVAAAAAAPAGDAETRRWTGSADRS